MADLQIWTTVCACMTHPVVSGWGTDWLSRSGGDLRLRRPVFDQDLLNCTISSPQNHNGPVIAAEVSGATRATFA